MFTYNEFERSINIQSKEYWKHVLTLIGCLYLGEIVMLTMILFIYKKADFCKNNYSISDKNNLTADRYEKL